MAVPGLRSAAAYGGQHLRRVIRGARDARPVLLDLAVRPDPDRRTDNAVDFLAVHHFVAEGAVGRHHLLRMIGEEPEWQAVVGGELLVRLGAVGRDTEHLDAL